MAVRGLPDPFREVVGHSRVAVVHTLLGALLGEVHIHHPTAVRHNQLAEGHIHLEERRTHEGGRRVGVVLLWTEAHLWRDKVVLICDERHTLKHNQHMAQQTHHLPEKLGLGWVKK